MEEGDCVTEAKGLEKEGVKRFGWTGVGVAE